MALITASYLDQEFVRVGYYVNNEYEEGELRENPPAEPAFEKLRTIASEQPRVTKFKVNWEAASTSDSPRPWRQRSVDMWPMRGDMAVVVPPAGAGGGMDTPARPRAQSRSTRRGYFFLSEILIYCNN